MIALALLLAATQVAMIDDIVRVPPAAWRGVDVTLRQRAATVECNFLVAEGRSGVRVMLLDRAEVSRMRDGRSFDTLAGTGYVRSGHFRVAVPRPSDYFVVVDNRMEGRDTAEVHLQVALVFDEGNLTVRQAPLSRRVAVIAGSLAFFFGVCLFAWRKLGPAMRAQRAEKNS